MLAHPQSIRALRLRLGAVSVEDVMASDPAAQLDALKEENQRLKRAIEEVSILNGLAVAIGTLRSSEEIIETIVKGSLRALQAEQGVITLIESSSGRPMETLIRAHDASRLLPRFHFSEALLGWMQLHKRPLVINDPRGDERFRDVTWDDSIRSLLAVPLIVKAELRAVLTVYNKKGEALFSQDDERLLAIIAGQSAQVLENARLYEQEQALVKMREQVRLAAIIQHELLPAKPPPIPGYEIGRSWRRGGHPGAQGPLPPAAADRPQAPRRRPMINTGLAQLLGGSVAELGSRFGLTVVVALLFLVTSVLSEIMSNNSTAVLMVPIAITTGASMGLDAKPLLMAVTIAAATSFLTPMGYKTNTVVYGPGGYRFMDYIRVGIPLKVIFWILATILIPVFWPI